MIIEITNEYHGTTELVEAESLEEAKNNHIGGLEVTAGNLSENEVEDDWADYYATYEEAERATYDDILEQLKSEVSYRIIEQPMTIKEIIKQLQELDDKGQNLPLYACDEDGNNFPIYSLSTYDSNAPHTESNPLGANYR